MSKYTPLWKHVKQDDGSEFKLTFAEIHKMAGTAIDHSFLNFKKEFKGYNYEMGKISLKDQTVLFCRIES